MCPDAAPTGAGVACWPAGERRSKRARKTRQPVAVASGTTLAELKLKVFEVHGVHPHNQRLYVRGGQLLEGEQCTLQQVSVYIGGLMLAGLVIESSG